MKIAHVCLSLGKGGAEKLLVDNLPTYVQMGHDVTIVQLSSILEEPSYIQTVEAAGIKVVTLSHGAFKNPMLIFKIVQLIKTSNFDVLHVHLFPCLYYVSLASRWLSKFPVVVFSEHNNQNRRMKKPYLQPIENFMYGRYDKIIAISENVSAMLHQWLPKLQHKITIIKNGVNIDKFRLAESYDDAYFDQHFGLKTGDVKLCMASRFNYQKDQQTIIRALQFLPDNVHVFFAGDGLEMQAAKTLTNELNLEKRVHFLGFRSDIPQLMKSADINILSSFFEGFSGVTLEALSSGKPFLGSDVSGINDIVPNRDFLFEVQNPEALAQKIQTLIQDPSIGEKMARIGLAHVQQFSMQNMIDAHLALYQELLTKHSNPELK